MKQSVHTSRPKSNAAWIALLVVAAMPTGSGAEEGNDIQKHHARASAEVEKYQPFPEDIEAVERVWGEPIPEHLHRIGGVDWWSWAFVEMVVENGKPRFFGEYRDLKQRYRGEFVYSHQRRTNPTPRLFDDYVMGHLSNDAIIFVEDDDEAPLDYFSLEPADPLQIERR